MRDSTDSHSSYQHPGYGRDCSRKKIVGKYPSCAVARFGRLAPDLFASKVVRAVDDMYCERLYAVGMVRDQPANRAAMDDYQNIIIGLERHNSLPSSIQCALRQVIVDGC